MGDALPPELLATIEAGDLDALVRFDTSALRLDHRAPSDVGWRDGSTSVRLTHQADAVLDHEPTERALLRGVRDSFAGNRAGLIEGAVVEPPLLEGERVLHLVAKVLRGDGEMAYLAMLRIPLVAGGFDIAVQGADPGMAGTREAAVLEGRATPARGLRSVAGMAAGSAWITDLFDGGGSEAWLPNRSDDAGYDRAFPAHPLSVVRRVCAGILATLTLAPACLDALQRSLPAPASGWV